MTTTACNSSPGKSFFLHSIFCPILFIGLGANIDYAELNESTVMLNLT